MYLVVGGAIVAAIHSVLFTSQIQFREQQAMARNQGVLRNAMAMFAGELRGLSAPEGDLLQMDSTFVRIRSRQADGVICGVVDAQGGPTYSIVFEAGTFTAGPSDSTLVLALNSAGRADDDWRALRIVSVAVPDTPESFTCDWAVATNATRRLTVAGDTAGVSVGSPVRGFRHVAFGLFQWETEWWLGRRFEGQAWEPLTGPLLAPQDSGLVLTYLNADGNPAMITQDVRSIDIILRKQRQGETTVDSLHTRVALRG